MAVSIQFNSAVSIQFNSILLGVTESIPTDNRRRRRRRQRCRCCWEKRYVGRWLSYVRTFGVCYRNVRGFPCNISSSSSSTCLHFNWRRRRRRRRFNIIVFDLFFKSFYHFLLHFNRFHGVNIMNIIVFDVFLKSFYHFLLHFNCSHGVNIMRWS